jgi:hypothetical protein
MTGHDLTEPELRALVRELAARPEDWRHLIAHDRDRSHCEELRRDAHLSVWLICWDDAGELRPIA